jgi:RNA polymerase sigma factor (sigma-70 family)
METLLPGNIASDAGIIEKINLGELALFEVLIRRYNPALYKIARGYGFNHHDAEDLMQDTHVAAYQHLRQFEGKSSYKTWVSKIMIHKCVYKINHGRSRNEQPGSDIIYESSIPMLSNDRNITPEQSSINKEFSSVLEHALQKLPLTHRSVFVLRQVEGFSVAETAEMLNISQVNVKVRFNRSKAMLQKELEQFYTATNLYEFNLVYCDEMVSRVFRSIDSLENNGYGS